MWIDADQKRGRRGPEDDALENEQLVQKAKRAFAVKAAKKAYSVYDALEGNGSVRNPRPPPPAHTTVKVSPN